MNIEEARKNLNLLGDNNEQYQETAWKKLESFINEVEELLKNNSIKQTPALLRK